MFVRKKPNKSGVVSIQIIDKSRGRYRLVKTVGSSADPAAIDSLFIQAKQMIPAIQGQGLLNFEIANEQMLMDLFFNGLEEIQLAGPELILGKLFDEIGFNKIKEDLFRHLVIARLAYPVSKLKTSDYLFKYKGIRVDVDKIYRYLDKLSSQQKETVQQISYNHTLQILNNNIGVVFYDVTTLYFEIDDEDDLRKTGFSKEGKHQHPQIVLGLLVSVEGYPLAYEIFEGSKYEGHTLLPVIEKFKHKYHLTRLVVIADAGLLSNENITELQGRQYEYILGARIKNESLLLKNKILSLKLENGQSAELIKDDHTKIIVSYSEARAKKDAANRKKGLEKLERSIANGKLTKNNINNRGYNKYLKLEGEIKITIDKAKYLADAKWDGLKGYITNTQLSKDEIIENYKQLWKIEKAFRISKTDLRIRPIYHRLKHRIEAHICIAFCAYKIYKELERQLQEKQTGLSAEKAIDIANTIYRITINRPFSKTKESRLHLPKEEQQSLLKWFNV
ncbi:MAG TPA: IS1634 family transposase [Chitinophagaceae bacterium]|nr:IS1634 family transposase [Chitinophagaceae bacterium]